MNARYPGIPTVINGNGAVAQVMGHVCGGVIGYPITPSTEIAEIYEAFRSACGCNVWGKHPFFFEPEGEHSAQSGALGAALTGGKFVSNASSSQGILYGLESHYVTVGKKVGGFVLQVAARVVSKHSLNVMAGHDDVYALLQSGYTILFGSNPQEAADLASIAYKVSATSLIPVTNAMDGFATSHMMSEALVPEPELLREFLGDPAGRIKAPTVAQEILFGAKGRVFQLKQYITKHQTDLDPAGLVAVKTYLDANADAVEKDNTGELAAATLGWLPEELRGQWRRQWLNAFEKGTRQLVPALVDINNPGLTGGVQNQPDFQAGSVDHRTHFVRDVPRFVREAMAEYSTLTGRECKPVMTFMCDDADYVMVGLGSVTDDAEAVAAYLRGQGKKAGVVSVKLLQPFPEAELVAALAGKKAVTVLERSDVTALTTAVTQALFKGVENAAGERHPGIPAIQSLPKITTAIFGLGAHDLQPRHLIAAYKNMETTSAPFVYLGSQFFVKNPTPKLAALQERLKAAYPETELMALETEPNPNLLPSSAMRIRFHSVGGYGTIATGMLLTDILAGVLDLHSKAAPKYGSEKSGAPTNYYITLSPEPVKITNAELEDVEIVVSPDHKVFSHTNPLLGLIEGGTFLLQTNFTPPEVWRELPKRARQTIRDKKIKMFVIDGFAVAKRHAPTPELETRMMGIAFIGAICGHVDRIVADAPIDTILTKVRQQISKKFGAKGAAVVEGNMGVIKEGLEATQAVDYTAPEFAAMEAEPAPKTARTVAISAGMCRLGVASSQGFFDREYYDEMVAAPFREGHHCRGAGAARLRPVYAGRQRRLEGQGPVPARGAGVRRRPVHRLHGVHAGVPGRRDPEHGARHPRPAARRYRSPRGCGGPARGHARSGLAAQRGGARGLSQHQRGEAVPQVGRRCSRRPRHRQRRARAQSRQARRGAGGVPSGPARPFFDAMEKDKPGSGGLFSAAVDPWKCTGCLECVDVCGPGALKPRHQDAALLDTLQARFEFLSKTPNTPARFVDGALAPGEDTKRLMLDRANYYATTGGHGACRGCGEVTAIRLVTSTNHAIKAKQRKEQIRDLEGLIEKLSAKLASVQDDASAARAHRQDPRNN